MLVLWLLRRYFWVLVLALLLASAYLQAHGVSALAASGLSADLVAPETAIETAASPKSAPVQSDRNAPASAQPILDRNVFDSTAVPLRPPAAAPLDSAAPPPPVDPLHAPKCHQLWVTSTIMDDDPLWSSAVLREANVRQGTIRRVGDAIGERIVAYIGFNPLERSPAVWLLHDSEGLCQSVLFAERPPPPPKKPGARQNKAKPKARRRPAKQPTAPPVPRAIAQKIQRVSPTEFRIDRSALDAIMNQHAQLMRNVRVSPKQQGGRTTGLALSRVTSNSLLGAVGLRNGDQLVSINGFDLTSPERALQAYARLRTASNISLQIVRRGKPVVIDYRIQ